MTQSLDIDKMLADAEYAYAMDEECGWDAPDDIIRALRMLKRRTEVATAMLNSIEVHNIKSLPEHRICSALQEKAWRARLAYQGDPDA